MTATGQSHEFPEKTCDIDRLIRHPRLVAAAKAGDKTQQRRNGVYAYPGEHFFLGDIEFVMLDLKRQSLADMTENDARAEGYPGLDEYRTMILKMHPGMEWNESGRVWVHYFELR